jgi:hypothetical protein
MPKTARYLVTVEEIPAGHASPLQTVIAGAVTIAVITVLVVRRK